MSHQTFNLEDGPFLVLDLPEPHDVQGFGGHVSTSLRSDGYGGYEPELYFTAGTLAKPGQNLVFHLFEGHDRENDSLHHYRVDLGPKGDVYHASVCIGREALRLEWSRMSRNRNDERHQYGSQTRIPLADHVGFWRNDPPTVHGRQNGVLSSRRGREGRGYDGIRFALHSVLHWRDTDGSSGSGTRTTSSTGPE